MANLRPRVHVPGLPPRSPSPSPGLLLSFLVSRQCPCVSATSSFSLNSFPDLHRRAPPPWMGPVTSSLTRSAGDTWLLPCPPAVGLGPLLPSSSRVKTPDGGAGTQAQSLPFLWAGAARSAHSELLSSLPRTPFPDIPECGRRSFPPGGRVGEGGQVQRPGSPSAEI